MSRNIDHEKFVVEVIEPILVQLQEEHGAAGGEGYRACPVCGGRMRYQVASDGGCIGLLCEEDPGCFMLMT